MAGIVIGTTDVPVSRLASRLDRSPKKEERSLSAPTYTGEQSMSKLVDTLREMRVFSTHELLVRFRSRNVPSIACTYAPADRWQPRKSTVYSPVFKTDTGAAWYDYGCKTFVGKRAASMPQALAWAEAQYGVREWAPSPFGGYIPKAILDAAKKAAKEHSKQREGAA